MPVTVGTPSLTVTVPNQTDLCQIVDTNKKNVFLSRNDATARRGCTAAERCETQPPVVAAELRVARVHFG